MTETSELQLPEDRPLEIAGRVYQSRLLVGTGKYRDMMETGHAIESSGAEIVTVAVRRTNLGQNPDEPNLLDVISPSSYTICPTRRAAIPRKTPSAPASWPASFWMATTW